MQDPVFQRPIFIISPPRSGSTLLFETLLQAPRLYTIGGESHRLIEGMPQLSVAGQNFTSNRLVAADATPQVYETLRQRFLGELRDRDGARPAPSMLPVRMLEKTPKNALRIPFLAQVFPEARFVYLHREPRQVMSSMLDAWRSGRFRTYGALPGWTAPLPWSLLLIPGWRDLADKPLAEIIATQWEVATRIALDDLEMLSRDRWIVARYDALSSDWGAEIQRLCAFLGLDWDRPLSGALPNSRYTLSAPNPEKWRTNRAEVEPQLLRVAATIERLAAAVA